MIIDDSREVRQYQRVPHDTNSAAAKTIVEEQSHTAISPLQLLAKPRSRVPPHPIAPLRSVLKLHVLELAFLTRTLQK